MLDKLKTLVSRLSLHRKVETSLHRKVLIGVKQPYWLDGEKEVLVNLAKTPVWHKLRLTAHSLVLYDVLVNSLSDDYKRGYLECFASLDELIKGFASESQIDEIDKQDLAVSMQGLDEGDKTEF